MLNDYQTMVVRRAMAAAVDKDAEIKRIAKGMKVEESEIQQVLAQMPREEPAASSNSVPAGRALWTTKRLEQLHQLRAERKGPTEIALIMGLKTHQVQSRLHSEKKSRSVANPSTPAKAEPEPNSDDPPVAPPELLPEPELVACEAESPNVQKEPSVISKNDPDSFSFAAAAMVKRPFLFAIEITNLMRSLEYSHPPVEMGAMSANQSEGWAECHFTAAGEEIFISLRREERKS